MKTRIDLGDISPAGEARYRSREWDVVQNHRSDVAAAFLRKNLPDSCSMIADRLVNGTRWSVNLGIHNANIETGRKFCSRFGALASYEVRPGSREEYMLKFASPSDSWQLSTGRHLWSCYFFGLLLFIGFVLVFKSHWIFK